MVPVIMPAYNRMPLILEAVKSVIARSYKNVAYSYELTTKVNRTFINLRPGKVFETLSRRHIAHFLSEAAVQRFSTGHYGIAMQQLGLFIWMKDIPWHWLSALKRGIYAACKKCI